MNPVFIRDYERFTTNKYSIIPFCIRYFRNHELRYIYWGIVKAMTHNPIRRVFASMILRRYRRLYGLELNSKYIVGGIRLIHPWCISVSDNATIEEKM